MIFDPTFALLLSTGIGAVIAVFAIAAYSDSYSAFNSADQKRRALRLAITLVPFAILFAGPGVFRLLAAAWAA